MRAEKTGEEGIQLNLLSPKVSHLTSFHIPLVRTSYVAPLREARLGNEVQLCPEEENRTVWCALMVPCWWTWFGRGLSLTYPVQRTSYMPSYFLDFFS